ncbi:MAG: 3-deoxy-D-manno-octulosonic acid transferase [Deltaproteobacteria bacterium]|nr:3-deoxy-D-manno-octulosonic acid transferase [Deltaproteobacteria bacterium]
MYIFYNLLLWIFFLAALPFLFFKMILNKNNRQIFAQKLGFVPEEILAKMKGQPRIWVHAVSVGEVSAIHPLLRQLRAAYPKGCLVLSTGTKSGQKVARERVSEATAIFFFPLDLPFIVRRVIRKVRADLFILAETEIWPNFLRIMKEEGGRTMLANGRISDRSFPRYRKTRFFWTAVLDYLDAMSMIRVQDGERIISMGANPVHVFVNGNCKFDQAAFMAEPAYQEEMKELLGVDEKDRVFVAGSTHEGEEEIVLQAFLSMRQRYPNLILALVPRHAQRADRLEKLLVQLRIEDFIRRSQLGAEGRKGRRVVLWDTFGELFKIYSLATVVFCGGSLVPRRGQNILEPAAWGKVVLYGPSMEDFLDAHQLLKDSGAGIMIRSAEELAERSLYFLDNPQELKKKGEAGKEALLSNRGATQRNFELARKLVET